MKARLLVAAIVCLVAGCFDQRGAALRSSAKDPLRSSAVYKLGLERAKESDAVQQLLGTPIREGGPIKGKIVEHKGYRRATLAFPLHGPKGSATLEIDAMDGEASPLKDGGWFFETLRVVRDGSDNPIDLRPGTEK